jgi:hypothetical protein
MEEYKKKFIEKWNQYVTFREIHLCPETISILKKHGYLIGETEQIITEIKKKYPKYDDLAQDLINMINEKNLPKNFKQLFEKMIKSVHMVSYGHTLPFDLEIETRGDWSEDNIEKFKWEKFEKITKSTDSAFSIGDEIGIKWDDKLNFKKCIKLGLIFNRVLGFEVYVCYISTWRKGYDYQIYNINDCIDDTFVDIDYCKVYVKTNVIPTSVE